MDSLERARALLSDLVGFETVSSEANLTLIAYVADILSGLGAQISMSLDPTGTKANLFATLGGEGNGGIVLSGHTDVVPVEGQDWLSDPFRLAEREGRLYGRGACDMKGFIACCLAAAPAFAATDLKRPLHFAFTYDEEVGCLGARTLIAELEKSGLSPAIAIIGEPTEMRIVEGHKGNYEYSVEFTGLEGHASQPGRGVNAVEFAARYMARLLQLAEELKSRAPAASRFEPPWTTLQIGRIAGGIAHNVIPGHCAVDWEMRPVQSADVEHVKRDIGSYVEEVLLPAMQAVSPDAGILTRVIGEVVGLEPADDSEARRLLASLTGQNAAHVVSFGTEGGLFQELGISTIICGPGSIAQAHRPDEFIVPEQLAACLEMLERLRVRLATEP